MCMVKLSALRTKSRHIAEADIAVCCTVPDFCGKSRSMDADVIMSTPNTSLILFRASRIFRKCILCVLSAGVIPEHIAFIMDGKRRFAKKKKLAEGARHEVGFGALMTMLFYCHELGVEFVTGYVFSIDNFKRSPEEVQLLMDLMKEKIQFLSRKMSLLQYLGIRIHLAGNLDLFDAELFEAAKRLMGSNFL